MMKLFENQVAIVTGAASGLGLSIAHQLHQLGAKVVLVDIDSRSIEHLSDTWGADVFSVSVDITQQEEVQNKIRAIIHQLGRVDVLVNAAGITGLTQTTTHLMPIENIRHVFEINFWGTLYLTQAVLPTMLQQNYGRILHIASIAGKEGNPGMLGYSASKAAVIGMAKAQGKEYAETGITINALAPAVIMTPLVDALPEATVRYMTDKIPMKRAGTLQEVAEVATFIVSPHNSFTTGFCFDLSGGRATY